MKALVTTFLFLLFISACSDENSELFEELKAVAENGSVDAQYHLGMFYNNGLGTDINYQEAAKWFRKSAENGDPLGHYKLGCYYAGQAGEVVPIIKNKALEHKLVAAQAGYSLAQFEVAGLYYEKADYQNAAFWLEQSVQQGHPPSFYGLFSMYYQGNIAKNIEKSYWLLKVIDKNSNEEQRTKIQPMMAELRSQLNNDQINEIEADVAAWLPKQSELTIKARSGIEETKKLISTVSQ